MSDRLVWVACERCGLGHNVSSSLQGPRPRCAGCGAVLVIVPTNAERLRARAADLVAGIPLSASSLGGAPRTGSLLGRIARAMARWWR